MKNLSYIALTILLALLIGFGVGYLCMPTKIEYKDKPYEVIKTETKIETQIKEVPAKNEYRKDKPIQEIDTTKFTFAIDSLKKEISKFNADSLYCSKPFIDSIQTIQGGDTAVAVWTYPTTWKQLILKPRPDTLTIRTVTNNIEKPRAWYDSPWIGSAATVGIEILGLIIYNKTIK